MYINPLHKLAPVDMERSHHLLLSSLHCKACVYTKKHKNRSDPRGDIKYIVYHKKITILYHAIENRVDMTVNARYTWNTMGRLGVIPSSKRHPVF